MKIEGTLCYLIREGQALLLQKARGFGKGKWNAPGGKLAQGESPEACVKREVLEEAGFKPLELNLHGKLDFYFGQEQEPDWIVHVFSSRKFEGNVKSSVEGSVRWFPIEALPYGEMWADDVAWVPLLLLGKRFLGRFYFDAQAERLLHYFLIEQFQPSKIDLAFVPASVSTRGARLVEAGG